MVQAVVFVVVTAVLGALLKARRSDARASMDGHVLEYHGAWRGLAIVSACFVPLLLGVLFLFGGGARNTHQDAYVASGLVTFFALLGGYLYVETSRRYRLRPEGLFIREAWGPEQCFAWEELSRVRSRPVLQQLELHFGPRRISLSRYLSGLESLAEALRRYAPAIAASPTALHAVLVHAGGGQPLQQLEPRRPTPRGWGDRWRDATGDGYDALTGAFEPAFTRWVATWPIVCVLPMGGGEGPGHELEEVLASLLRRDLGLAGAVSVLGNEETGSVTLAQLLEYQREQDAEPLRWKHVAAVGCEAQGPDLVLHGRLWTTDTLNPPRELRVSGPADTVGALTAELAQRFAEALELPLTPEVTERWRRARPRSLAALSATARACEEENLAWLSGALARGEAHPNALTLVDTDEAGAEGQAALARAALADPADAQLCFLLFTKRWKGQGRDSAAARVLIAGLQAAPGHGKSQMCLAHLFQRTPANAERILAHAQAGESLLPGNPYALGNFLGYLNTFAPHDPRRGVLVERMLAQRPDHPDTLRNAMDFFIQQGEARRALELAHHFEKLCTEPVSPEVLYALRQNPATAAALDSGQQKPLDEARRCVAICEAAV
ncbi:MAG TPA: hypothetical protein VF664_08070, partial [Cystobacter sp.]